MTTPTMPPGASPREMRKAVLRMRLEMRRQEIRHEALQLTSPLRQARDYGQRLRQGTAPIWLAGGAATLTALLVRKRGMRSLLRLALLVIPLLRHRPMR